MATTTTHTKPSLTNQIALLLHMIEGLKKHFAPASTLVVRGTSYSRDDLVKVLEDLANVYQAVFDAKSKAHDAILAARTASKEGGLVARAFRGLVYASFKDASDLADFGLPPRKTRVPATVDQLQTAAEKRRATRAARHTLGKRQKAAIKGTVGAPKAPPSPPSPSPSPNPPNPTPNPLPSAVTDGGNTPPKGAAGSPA